MRTASGSIVQPGSSLVQQTHCFGGAAANMASPVGVAGGSGGSTHFLLKYPLEGDLVAVNAKTSQMQARCSSGLQPKPSPSPRTLPSL